MTNFQPIVEETQQALRDDPALASASFAVASRQIEGLCSEVTARDFKLTVDEPEILGGTDRGPYPVELVLAALASCQEITYRLYADSLGIPLEGVSVKVTGDLDLRGLFAVDKSVRPGFGEIRAEVTLDSPASDAELARLKEVVDRHCPVLDILTAATPVSTGLAGRDPVHTKAAE